MSDKKLVKLKQKFQERFFGSSAKVEKRFKAVREYVDAISPTEASALISSHVALCWEVCTEMITATNIAAKKKQKALAYEQKGDLWSVIDFLKLSLTSAPALSHDPSRSAGLSNLIAQLLSTANTAPTREAGFSLLLAFMESLRDETSVYVLSLFSRAINLDLFREQGKTPAQIDYSSIPYESIPNMDRLFLTSHPSSGSARESESRKMIDLFLSYFAGRKDKFDSLQWWWGIFKKLFVRQYYSDIAEKLGLPATDDDALQPFLVLPKCPAEVQAQVLLHLSLMLRAKSTVANIFATAKDLDLVLEILKSSLFLDMSQYQAAVTAMGLYRGWFMEKFPRPEVMKSQQQHYTRIFIEHMSVVFYRDLEAEKCSAAEKDIASLANLCQLNLETWAMVAEHHEETQLMDFDTWNYLLRTFISVVDHVLMNRGKSGSTAPRLCSILKERMLKVLFHCWLRSVPDRSRDELWKELRDKLRLWIYDPITVEQWMQTCIRLTSSIVTDIYERPDCARECPNEHLKDLSFLGTDMITFCWDQLIHTIEEPTSIDDEQIYGLVMGCYAEVIDILLGLHNPAPSRGKGVRMPPPVHPPELNTLLDVFGTWIFDSCNRLGEKYVEGRRISYVTLCRIMTIRSAIPIREEYLANFYSTIHLGLSCVSRRMSLARAFITQERMSPIPLVSGDAAGNENDSPQPDSGATSDEEGDNASTPSRGSPDWKLSNSSERMADSLTYAQRSVIRAILLSAHGLVAMDYPGIIMLIEGLLRAAECALVDEHLRADIHVREAVMHIAMSVSCWSYQYKDAAVPIAHLGGAISGGMEIGTPFSDLKDSVLRMLFTDVDNEPYAICVALRLRTMLVMIYEECASEEPSTDFIRRTVDVIMRTFAHRDLAVVGVALECVTSLTPIGPKLSPQLVCSIVNRLCTYILGFMRRPLSDSIVSVTATAIYSLQDWVAICPAVIDEKEVLGKLCQCLANGVSTGHPGLVEACSIVEMHIMCSFRNFPTRQGAQQCTSYVDDYRTVPATSDATEERSNRSSLPISAAGGIGEMVMRHRKSIQAIIRRDSSAMNDPLDNVPQNAHWYIDRSTSVIMSLLGSADDTDEGTSAGKDADSALLFTRDCTGRYCWEATPLNTAPYPGLTPTASGEDASSSRNMTSTPTRSCDSPVPERTGSPAVPATATAQEVAQETVDMLVDGVGGDAAGSETTAAGETDAAAGEQSSGEAPVHDPSINTDQVDMFERLLDEHVTKFPDYEAYTSRTRTIDIENDPVDEDISKRMEEQRLSELQQLSELGKSRTDVDVRCPIPEPEKPLRTTDLCRQLLAHLGLVSVDHRHLFKHLEVSPKLFRSLRQLDKTATRECHKVGVIYVRNGQEDQRSILQNEGGSDAYQAFVRGLGWSVDLKTHTGFPGGLDPDYTTGCSAPYYADATMEVIFHVVTRMPTKADDNLQIIKKRHVGNDFVNIVWSEHARDYSPQTITSQFNTVVIVVYPLKCDLYRIRMHFKDGITVVGPLLDGMIVSGRVLPILVRATAVNANRAVRYAQEGYRRPYPTRSTLVNEIFDRCPQELSPEDMHQLMLTTNFTM